jgi:nitroreductase
VPIKLEQRFVADEKSVVYKRAGLKGLLYRTLPTGAYDYLRGARLKLAQSPVGARLSLARAATYDTLAKSGLFSGLYYAFGSRTYDREHKATLTARAKYLRDVHTGDGNVFVLRRNVHKLEKALVMKPRREVFALAFIHETVTSYADCVARLEAGQLHDTDTLEWSRQVLRVYFGSITKSHPIVEQARAVFEAAARRAPGAASVGDQARVPFARQAAPLPSYDSLLQLAQQRRSVRWFDGRPVPRELLDRAVVLAGLSPSACNRQPFRFAIFDDPELCQKVAAIPKGTPGWVHNIPCFLVIVGTLAAFDREKDRHIPYIDGALAAMALCFALESQGVSSCCVNWPDLAETEARMARTLGLSPYERPIMCMAIGYPDMSEKVPYSQKLPLDELRSYNRVPK